MAVAQEVGTQHVSQALPSFVPFDPAQTPHFVRTESASLSQHCSRIDLVSTPKCGMRCAGSARRRRRLSIQCCRSRNLCEQRSTIGHHRLTELPRCRLSPTIPTRPGRRTNILKGSQHRRPTGIPATLDRDTLDSRPRSRLASCSVMRNDALYYRTRCLSGSQTTLSQEPVTCRRYKKLSEEHPQVRTV